MKKNYHCTSCEYDFEIDDSDKLRCPKCLRQNGIEALDDDEESDVKKTPKGRNSKPFVLILSAISVIALIAIGALWQFKRVAELPKPGQLAIVDPPMMRQLLKKRGIDEVDQVNPFSKSKNISDLIGKLSASNYEDKAKEIATKLATKLKGLTGNLSGRISMQIRTAEELAVELSQKELKLKRITSLEAAILLASVLRMNDIDAIVAEASTLDAKTKSANVSMSMGRFIVSIYPKNELNKKALLDLDPIRATQLPNWAGGSDKTMKSIATESKPLDDATVVAHFYSQRSLAEVKDNPTAPRRAYELSLIAQKLGHQSSTLHLARAFVLLQAGQAAALNEVFEETDKAVAIDDNAPTNTAYAQFLLIKGNIDGAEKKLKHALEKERTYWPASLIQATLFAMKGNREASDKAIKHVIQIAPNEAPVLALRAGQAFQENKIDEGLNLLRQAATNEPTETMRLQLYHALIKAEKGKEARALRKTILKETKLGKIVKAQLEKIELALGFDPENDPSTDSINTPTPSGLGSGGGLKLPDVKLNSQASSGSGLKLPDVKLTP